MFGPKLKELREGKSWSQSRLAQESGLPQKSISSWENDQAVPLWDSVVKLCRSLGVECKVFEEVFDESPETPTPKAGRGRPAKKPVEVKPTPMVKKRKK
ncbi:XRE family transcriptional regulator [Limnoglobus roseus]|uniref:XRE family transcriptional regulator n=1 Tax=Limnoglobus roseus TaxID=2598579 RepID=A0A5C1AK78_9BACT|nr:XRE family transcriptional regulator [Limnoglobus roseus]